MKKILQLLPVLFLLASYNTFSQDSPIKPAFVRTGHFLGVSMPARDLPVMTAQDFADMQARALQRVMNQGLGLRSYPYAATAQPQGPDPVWQTQMGMFDSTRMPILNFDGTNSPYYPPDANGAAGPNHYMQAINTVYTIYNKVGSIVAGPTAMNLLFGSVPGAQYNDGDPIVLYDEQADRWLAAEFSITGSNDYMLVAISTTNDPTGTWYQYSFDVDNMPDYPKFGVWQDGYYMGTNNSSSNDIYVFQRSQMLVGGTAQMVGFNNAWRPTTNDGFMCVPPVDNDGTFAPAGSPGLFITINDDAIGGGTDQLWIYELAVNWSNPSSSTFTRTQQVTVPSFDSNFGNTWDNISQPGTNQKLDAIPQVVMNVPQYRNFGSYQTIVCCHTVDVDNTDHAGIRWYELRRTTGSWSIRQSGTYAPDANSRWMGSIALNGNNEIGLGYSISSTTVYPGIRYTGQSNTAYAAGAGTLDITESTIQTGANSQTNINRWGDYSAMTVDPSDDQTFWFTSEYIGSGGARKTKIATFGFAPNANFSADNTAPNVGVTVHFTDLSGGAPTGWSWSFNPTTVTFVNGSGPTSQNPAVQFNADGAYSVTLTITTSTGNNTETKANYIHVGAPGQWTGSVSGDWNDPANWTNGQVPTTPQDVTVESNASYWPVFSGNFTVGVDCNSVTMENGTQMTVNGNLTINPGKSFVFNGTGTLSVGGNWSNWGHFTPGTGTVQFNGSGTGTIPSGVNPAMYLVNYTRTTSAAGLTNLTGASMGPSGDEGSWAVPIGFTFNYLGVDYTQATVCTNGWINLDGSTGTILYENQYLFSSDQPNTTLAPWWDDLTDDNTSTVTYKTTGTAPNRVFTVEWYRVKAYYTQSNTRITFQVKLFETTNEIQFLYGTLENSTHNSNESASIGIEDAIGGLSHFIEATTGSMTTGVSTLVTPANWPAVNYTFTPPPKTQTFYNIVVNKNNATLVNQADVVVNGTLTITP